MDEKNLHALLEESRLASHIDARQSLLEKSQDEVDAARIRYEEALDYQRRLEAELNDYATAHPNVRPLSNIHTDIIRRAEA